MENNNQTIKSIIALLLGIFFAVVLSELILQILDIPKQPVSGWVNCKYENPGECNSMGFRGRELTYTDDDIVVLLVGDSEVYAASFPFEQIPERRLEHFLEKYESNVKVFTIADMGYGQDQQYLALKKYFENYRADLVLLMFTARNDIDNNLFPTSGANNTIKPTFWLEDGSLRVPTEGWLEPVGTKIKLALLWQSYLGKSIGESRAEKWKKDILPTPYKPLKQYEGEVDYSWLNRKNENPEKAFGIKYERVRDSIKWTPRSEMREYGINLTRKLFSEIKELIEVNNGQFVIFKEERPWELKDLDKEKAFYLNDNYYIFSNKQYHDNLKDLFYGFAHYRIPLGIDKYIVKEEDLHLSHQAIDILFEKISEKLNKQRYLKRRNNSK